MIVFRFSLIVLFRVILDEADRSVHDALCVVRSLVKKRFMISGGGSPEAEMSLRLSQWAKTLTGIRSYCVRAFAEVSGLTIVLAVFISYLFPLSVKILGT